MLARKPQMSLLPPGRHVRKLNSLGACLTEMARTYRLGVNGKIGLDEMTKRVFVLDRLRAGLEAQQARVDVTPVARPILQVSIVAIPNGEYLTREEVAATHVGLPTPFLTPDPPGMSAADVSAAVIDFPARHARRARGFRAPAGAGTRPRPNDWTRWRRQLMPQAVGGVLAAAHDQRPPGDPADRVDGGQNLAHPWKLILMATSATPGRPWVSLRGRPLSGPVPGRISGPPHQWASLGRLAWHHRRKVHQQISGAFRVRGIRLKDSLQTL